MTALGVALIALGGLAGFAGYFAKGRHLDAEAATRLGEAQTGLSLSVVGVVVAVGVWCVQRAESPLGGPCTGARR